LDVQSPIEAAWAQMHRLDPDALNKETALLALVDTLSLALCGELKAPMDLTAPGRNGDIRTLRLAERPGHPYDFTLSPWPFRTEVVAVEGEARPLPAEGRFSSEAHMRAWLSAPKRTEFRARLCRRVARNEGDRRRSSNHSTVFSSHGDELEMIVSPSSVRCCW
jgi:hypothetical protein